MPWHYTEMGRLVADAGKRDWDELTAEYGANLMEGLGVMGTRGKHVNVPQHLMGYLKNHLSSEDKQALASNSKQLHNVVKCPAHLLPGQDLYTRL